MGGMAQTVYIETSIFSFYFDQRTSPDVVARRAWTRQWWAERTAERVRLTSLAVIAELKRGTLPHQADALRLAETLTALPVPQDIQPVVEFYIEHHVMPRDPLGDALHLAIASRHACDFLVTWNCRHLANANKFGHIHRVNSLLGLHVPLLVTPLELLGVEDEDESRSAH